ncbi:MAG: hypothetical protein N2171_07955 [Clostridia bacterium]|nr:hypothetical protein [Clostridia bacterium]
MYNYYLQQADQGIVIYKVEKSTVKELDLVTKMQGDIKKIYSTDAQKLIKRKKATLILN